MLLSSFTFSINCSECVTLAAIHARVITLPPPCLSHDVGLWIISYSFPSTDFLFQSFNLIWVSSVQTIWFQSLRGFFSCFLAKPNPSFLFLNVPSGLYLVVNRLYLHSWQPLIIVEFDIDTLTFSWVFSTCLHVVKGFFFTKKMILYFNCLLQALWCVWAHQCILFSPSFCCVDRFFWLFSINIASFTCINMSWDFILIGSVKQLPNVNRTA